MTTPKQDKWLEVALGVCGVTAWWLVFVVIVLLSLGDV